MSKTTDPNQVAMKAIAARYLESFLAGERAPAELYAPQVTVWHNVGELEQTLDEPPSFGRLRKVVPDARHEDLSTHVHENGFVIQATIAGTLQGAPLHVPVCLVVTVVDGRITRFEEYVDGTAAAPILKALRPPPGAGEVPAFVTGLRDELVKRFDMTEQDELVLGEVGTFRVWTGDAVRRLAHVQVATPQGLEANMLVAHTPAGSPAPHLGVDVMRFPNGFGFFVDLFPRVDLVSHRAYADAVYAGFDQVVASFPKDGLMLVPMPASMLAFYSPWMLHYFESPDLGRIATAVQAFADRFAELAEGGVPVDGLPDANALAERDRRHRGVLFDPDFDPVWKQVEPLLGAPAVTTIRETLGGPLD